MLFFFLSGVRRILIKALRYRKCVTILYISTNQSKEKNISTFMGVWVIVVLFFWGGGGDVLRVGWFGF